MKTMVKFFGDIKIDIESIKNNPYDILGIYKDADDAEILRAYKMLAAKFHPDKGKGNEEYFLLLGVAKATLLDPEKRELYDEYYIFGNDSANRVYRDALGQIQGMFLGVLQNAPQLDQCDIKGSMIHSTKLSIEKKEAEIAKVKANVEKSKKLMKRVSGTGKKGNKLIFLLNSQIELNEKQSIAQIGEFKKQCLIMEEVLVILGEFECTFEEMMEQGLNFGAASGFGGFR